MIIELFWSDKCGCNPKVFKDFAQRMANRLIVGQIRYGNPSKERRYMSRLAVELKAYRSTGNMEHLINIANYAVLESEAPENKRFHFDALVESATRPRFDGAK